jgi:hypothetical protein
MTTQFSTIYTSFQENSAYWELNNSPRQLQAILWRLYAYKIIYVRNITFSLERISWLYYFQLDRFIFERESGVWQFYLRIRLFCKHIASIKLLVIVLGNYLILNKHYSLEKMYKWLKIELSFFIIIVKLIIGGIN